MTGERGGQVSQAIHSAEDIVSPTEPLVEQGAANGMSPAAGSVTTRRLSDIEATPVSWLWTGRIARGKLTVVAGNPGLGKSQITASIASVVTTGGRWPANDGHSQTGAVLFLTAEDDPADTLRPRLEAAGADLRRVHIVESVIAGYNGDGRRTDRTFSLQQDIQALGTKLAELGDVAAVMIDPITAYLGDIDSHRNAEVRGLLAPLSEIAARYGVAMIAVSHLTKAIGAQALMRVTGSLAFVAAARAAYLVAADPQDRGRRLFLPLKNNLGPDATGLAFRIEGATVPSQAGPLATSRIVWEAEPVSLTADEVMAQSARPGRSVALVEAIDWLNTTLADGPVPATEIYERATSAGISKATLRRAKNELRIIPEKEGMKGGWCWSLPETKSKVLNFPEDAQQKHLSAFGEVEHLRETAEVEIEL